MDLIPWPSVGIGSGWLFVGLHVWAILTGRLVPKPTMDDARKDRDEWRSEVDTRNTSIAEQEKQLRHMAEVGKLQESILLAIRNAQARGSDS